MSKNVSDVLSASMEQVREMVAPQPDLRRVFFHTLIGGGQTVDFGRDAVNVLPPPAVRHRLRCVSPSPWRRSTRSTRTAGTAWQKR